MKKEHTRAPWILAVGLGAIGCLAPGETVDDAASVVPGAPAYYVYRDGILREANGGRGPCNDAGGGCAVTAENLKIDALGFQGNEAAALKLEARAGRAVLAGTVTVQAVQENQVPGAPVPASLAVTQVWRSPWPFQSQATLYLVRRALSAVGGPYALIPLNRFAESTSAKALNGIAQSIRADVSNRDGLIVQGTLVGDVIDRKVQAEGFFRHWEPALQFACDKSCEGFGSCTACNGGWSCTGCLGHGCMNGCSGPAPLVPGVICPNGTTPPVRCEPQEDDTCGWTLFECSAE